MSISVTGIGLICALGDHPESVLNRLCNSESGLAAPDGKYSGLKTDAPVGEVKIDNGSLAERLQLPSEKTYSRTMLLALYAVQRALENAQIDVSALRTGFISATSTGGIDLTEQFYPHFSQSCNKGRLRHIIRHDCGSHARMIASLLGIKRCVAVASTACSSAANAIILGARLLHQNRLDVVIAGGSDALCQFTYSGFDALKIVDRQFCRPFSQKRAGLNLGEGAAYIVMQREEPNNALCRLSGYANANDAYHQTASSPNGQGAFLAMKQAIESAGIVPADVDFINAHGTGTPNNDLAESYAILRLFSPSPPPFASLKGAVGHTLGASGSIAVAISALQLQQGRLFPSQNFQSEMEETQLKPLTESRSLPLSHILCNSFGFGGNNTSLLLSKTV
jgi:3-oxoacyl-[acyl-carrier-protein] synthase-1